MSFPIYGENFMLSWKYLIELLMVNSITLYNTD